MAPKTPRPALLIALITLMIAMGSGSMDVYLPSLPSIARDLAAEPGQVQLTLGMFVLGYAFANLVYGPVSDRLGRRPALLGGLALYLASSFACIFATSIEMLIALRFVQSLGACAGPVIGRASVRDLFGHDGAARAYSYIGMALTLSPVLAPILGGFLETHFGWRSNFVFMTCYGTLVLVSVVLALHETNPNPDREATRPGRVVRNYARLLGEAEFMGYGLTWAGTFSGIFAYVTGSSFVLIGLVHLSPATYGFVFAAVAVSFGFGSFASARLGGRWGIDGTIGRGLALYAVGAIAMNTAVLAGEVTALTIAGSMMVCAFGTGFVQPNCQAGAIGPYPHMAGTAAALTGFLQMSGAALSASILSAFGHASALPMSLTILGSAVVMWVVYVLLILRRHGRRANARPAGGN